MITQFHRGLVIAFLLPTALVFLVFYAAPIAILVSTSFTDWRGFDTPRFIGLGNYIALLSDEAFVTSVRNSILWGLLAAFVHVPFGILVALLINRHPFGHRFVRSVTLLPNLIAPAALALMYVLLFNPGIGAINQTIRLGFPDFRVNWFFEPLPAFIAVSSTWLFYSGVITLIALAELSSVPEELFDAARVDGASETQVDWHIRLPFLRSAYAVGVIIAVTSVFKLFESVYLTTKGGPGNETMSLGLLIFNEANTRYHYGYANAIGVILAIMGFLVFWVVARRLRLTEAVR